MKMRPRIIGLACVLAGTLGTFGQTVGLGLKFAATDPDAATSSLAPEEVAGVVPQANWNNLPGATGTGVTGLSYDNGGTATASSATVTWTAPNTWRSGGNNGFPDGPDRKLVSGYLDTGNAANNGVTITVNNLDAAFTGVAYDVYVYFVSDSNANRGGGYTINDGKTNIVKYGSTMGTPSAFVEDPGTDQNLSIDGNYLVFRHLTGSSFTLKTDTTLTSPNGFRAPVNAVQIVPSTLFGPDFVTQPSNESVYAGRTAHFTANVDGFPAVTSVKWQKDGVDVVDGGRISGATTTNLVITGVAAGDVGNYTLVATSPRGSNTSDAANLSIATQENSAYVTALVNAAPLANWRLNEADADTNVFDFIGGFTGSYADGTLHGSGVEGPRPTDFPGFASDNTAMQIDPTITPGWAQVPTPALNTNTATFVAWINPAAAQANFTGIFMTRTGTQAGFGYTTDNQLGYTWNGNSSATWGFNSGLRPPDNQWSLAVLVVNSNRATIYLGSGGTISAAINPIPHTAEVWGSAARIGIDGTDTTRMFNGKIDEVAMFNRALSFDEVAALYAAATGTAQNPAPIIAQQPVGATRYAGASVQLRAAATGVGNVTYQWKKGGANVVDNTRISGATTDTLTITGLTAGDAGDYTLVVTDPNGSTTTDVATVNVLSIPNAYVGEVIADKPISYWRLNETEDPSSGTAVAHDYVGGRDGTYGVSAMNAAQGVAGPRPDSGFGAFETDNGALQPTLNTADSWVTTPALGIATNQMTFLAWIKPTSRVANAGIIFVRNGQPATGLGLAGSGNLGYTWLDQAATYNFASGLTPPLNQW
ncbi:MAG TPA: LamG-like jellyroll fold domain-containing protein, partial [Verrucomicrobiae bacterium]